MIREEQIIEAGIEYTMQNSLVCIGGDNFYEQIRMFNRNRSFEAGANWADNNHPEDVVNLNNIWHPADKQPVGKDWKILLENKIGDYWVEGKCSVSFFYDSWQKYAEDVGLTRWAYISDLLPKGGKK